MLSTPRTRRSIPAALATAMLAALTACGPDATPPAPSPTADTPRVTAAPLDWQAAEWATPITAAGEELASIPLGTDLVVSVRLAAAVPSPAGTFFGYVGSDAKLREGDLQVYLAVVTTNTGPDVVALDGRRVTLDLYWKEWVDLDMADEKAVWLLTAALMYDTLGLDRYGIAVGQADDTYRLGPGESFQQALGYVPDPSEVLLITATAQVGDKTLTGSAAVRPHLPQNIRAR